MLDRRAPKLHNQEILDLYSSPNIIRMIRSRTTTWAEYGIHMEERRSAYMVLLGKP